MAFGFVKQLFTGVDNQTADIGRVLWFISVVSFIGFAAYGIHTGKYTFDPIAFGTGLATVIGAGAAALHFKSSTEPQGGGQCSQS